MKFRVVIGMLAVCCALCVSGCALFIDNTEVWVGKNGVHLGKQLHDGVLHESADGLRTITFHRQADAVYDWVKVPKYNFATKETSYINEYKIIEDSYDCTMMFNLGENDIITQITFTGSGCLRAFPERSNIFWRDV